MTLIPCEPNTLDLSDWSWNMELEQLGTISVVPHQLYPISPKLALGESDNDSPHWLFNTQQLLSYANLLIERGHLIDATIPHVKMTTTFPYRFNGKYLRY